MDEVLEKMLSNENCDEVTLMAPASDLKFFGRLCEVNVCKMPKGTVFSRLKDQQNTKSHINQFFKRSSMENSKSNGNQQVTEWFSFVATLQMILSQQANGLQFVVKTLIVGCSIALVPLKVQI